MSRFFKTRITRRVMPSIPLRDDFKCPACTKAETGVVLLCSRCWGLLLPCDRADLRRMTIKGQDTRSKLASCVAWLQERLPANPTP